MAVQLKPFLPMDLIEKIVNNNFSYTSSYTKKNSRNRHGY